MMSLIMMLLFMILMIYFKMILKYIFYTNIMMFMLMIFLMKFIYLEFMWISIYLNYGIDKYSYGMIILCLWIMFMMIFSSKKIIKFNLFMFMLLLLLLLLMMCFYSMNYLMFYLFFESSLIPTILLIIGWGMQPERIKAGYYMFLYTMFSSLPLLLMIFILKEYFFSLNYLILLNKNININYELMFYFFMIFSFMVKLPIFLFHLWLPKAHVEAPLVGSMILAGVMLKLGSYGLIRSMIMMMNLSMKFNLYMFILSLWGGLILSLICFMQIDLKMLVAYSSIVHMSIMLMGMLTLNMSGYMGSYLLMISHGICSSGLFYLVNLNYLRLNSRLFIFNKGMIMLMPNLSLWWFLMCVMNMSSPFSLNLFSEIMILMCLMKWSYLILLMLIFYMFLMSIYSIFLFIMINHGKLNLYINKMYFNYMNEYLLIMLHWFPMNLIFLNLNYLYLMNLL
uniref:NADH-ubiquinone oxidoreductase chain 4 n=1 Tax=Diapriidae sp. ZJUH_2016010 TaxID=2491155 RepID=A0A3S8V0K8_9HYME|nr:NADH dehydrogenase subunit 4 [Diapriidae sp. ZJUH_2016010]